MTATYKDILATCFVPQYSDSVRSMNATLVQCAVTDVNVWWYGHCMRLDLIIFEVRIGICVGRVLDWHGSVWNILATIILSLTGEFHDLMECETCRITVNGKFMRMISALFVFIKWCAMFIMFLFCCNYESVKCARIFLNRFQLFFTDTFFFSFR